MKQRILAIIFIINNSIYKFTTTQLGKRVKDAKRNGLLYREQQFVIGKKASEINDFSDAYKKNSDKIFKNEKQNKDFYKNNNNNFLFFKKVKRYNLIIKK